jgi:Leucine-rich repeat (LRR) protein
MLEMLDLGKDSIKLIEDFSFESLNQLTYLDLIDNQLESIKSVKMFYGLKKHEVFAHIRLFNG